jgi:hypothetical protein
MQLIPGVALMAIFSASVPLYSQEIAFKSNGAKATLVELYSSEGCSSCPPAEAWVTKLKTSPDLWKTVFPVVFHVDYWDGLGWPDRFARPAYTRRQQNYAAQLGQDSVYTPEFITNGREWRGWFHGEQNPSVDPETSGELSLQVKEDGKNVTVLYTPTSTASPQSYTVNVALLGADVLSNVQRGENGGRQLRHDFVVLDFASKPLAKSGNFQSGPMSLQSSADDPPAAIVAWISGSNGSILQVTGGWLKPSALSARASVVTEGLSQVDFR